MSIFIIGEIGINHRDLEICKDLIKVAKEAGCDAIKLQKDINKVYTKNFWILIEKVHGVRLKEIKN